MPTLTVKILPKIRKMREKIRKNLEKEGKIRKNREGSFTLPLLTDRVTVIATPTCSTAVATASRGNCEGMLGVLCNYFIVWPGLCRSFSCSVPSQLLPTYISYSSTASYETMSSSPASANVFVSLGKILSLDCSVDLSVIR